MSNVALPVGCYHQRSPDTCLAACVKMVAAYYGKEIDELKFYAKSRLGPYDGLCDVCIVPELAKRKLRVISYWDGKLEDWGVWNAELEKLYKRAEEKAKKKAKYARRRHATLDKIKKLIDKGTPVIAEVLAGKFYGTREIGTHMLLIRGYNGRGLHICDPWSKSAFITYSRFLRAWSPSERFGRSMIVITPMK